jgi:hypothetical protein
MYPRTDDGPVAAVMDDQAAMVAYGIERVPVDYFHWNDYRYTTLKDALAAARRSPAVGDADG